LTEAEIAEWLSDQMRFGSIEDIALRMARYALADPAAMREEFAERMGLFESDGEADEARQVGA
jgi:hypothetical protein